MPEDDDIPRKQPLALGVYALAVAGAVAGAIAGGAAGLIDGLWSWSDTSQFLADFASKTKYLCFLAASYGLAGALVGVLAAWTTAVFWRLTRLGDIVQGALARHRARRERDPRDALFPLSLVSAAIPCVAGALALAYMFALGELANRNHFQLLIASAMGMALAAVVFGGLLALLLARLIEIALRALAHRPTWGRRLSSPLAPLVCAGAMLFTSGLVAVFVTWDTLSLLPLRGLWVALLAAALSISTAHIGLRAAHRLDGQRRRTRILVPAACVTFGLALLLATGGADSVRKAARGYSGLGAHLPRPLRVLVDFDRDGYSSILGGGDCDDWNRHVHPGAVDIPDDGVDQNCVGGDVTLHRSVDDVDFASVPTDVPAALNVVLITIDTVRADHIGAYGYERPTSPHIDRVAREGTLFRNAWAHAPSTRYSIPAILTGRYPLSVDYDTSIQGWPGLDPKNTTIAEIMAARGMTTGAILNYWYFDEARKMNQGFAEYDNTNQRLHKSVGSKGPAQTKGSSSKEQTDKALQFVAKNKQQRFFLWVHYYDPHFKYERHAGTPSFGDSRVDLYDHEIRFTDHHIGRLLDRLRQLGVYERTAVVITGDHGEGFGEHGIDLHGYHLYAAQTKVPLIIRVPGISPSEVTMPASHVDILPTLANLVGAEPTTQMMGHSLVRAMTDPSARDKDRYVFQQLSYEGNHELRGAASSRCHVIYNVSPETSWELYRIDSDPLETRDIIDSPGACRGARSALEAWYDQSEIPPGAVEALLTDKPSIENPAVVDFGDAVRLLAVEFSATNVKAGQSFEVTYTFEARGPLPGGWKVFAHFEGPKKRRFQGDHAPPRPFAWWRENQYIRYRRTVTVPRTMAPGTYGLWMGLFKKSARQTARADAIEIRDNRARVGSVQVSR